MPQPYEGGQSYDTATSSGLGTTRNNRWGEPFEQGHDHGVGIYLRNTTNTSTAV